MFPNQLRQLFDIRNKSKTQKRRQSNRRRFIEHLEDRNSLAAAINVVPGASGTGDHDANLLDDGQISFADPDAGANTLSTGALLGASDAQSVLLEALPISFDDLGDVFSVTTTGNDVALSTDTAGGFNITFAEVSNTLELAVGESESNRCGPFVIGKPRYNWR